MNSKRILIGGLVAMLLAASLAFVTAGELEQRQERPRTVPAGFIGDEVVYVGTVHTWQTVWGEPTEEQSNFTLRLTVDGVETVADRAAETHDVVAVSFVHEGDQIGRQAGVEYVDLVSRDLVRYETLTESYPERATLFGPIYEPYWDYPDPWAQLPLRDNLTYQWQAMTFEPRGDLSGLRLSPGLDAYLNDPVIHVDGVLHDYRFESRVGGAGLLNGTEVFSINERLELDYTRSVQDDWVTRYLYQRDWTDTHETTIWLSEENPYPMRLVRDYVRHGEPIEFDYMRNVTVVMDQVAYHPGTEPVPWGACGADGHYQDANEELERASGPRHPVDGSHPRWVHGVTDAIRAVEGDPTLLTFRDWRQSHPDAVLVGTEFFRDVPGEPTGGREVREEVETWELLYAYPGGPGSGGQAFMVTSTLNTTTGLVENVEWGTGGVPLVGKFTSENLPTAPLTLSAVDTLWQRFGPDRASQVAPEYIQWGFTAYAPTSVVPNQYVACEPPACNDVTVRAWPELLESAWIGFQTYGTEPDTQSSELSSFSQDYHFIGVGINDGLMWSSYEYTGSFDYAPNPTGLDLGSTDDAVVRGNGDATTTAAPAAPVTLIGLAGTSLIAAFLLAYFFPLLKYAAGSGFGLLPGYAKVGRDEVLDNETRQMIHALIEQDPGISPPEIADEVDAGWSTIVYHLRVLEKNEFVSSLIDGRHKRFFPTDSVDWNERGKLAALKNDRTRQIYEMLEEEPGLARQDISQRMEFTVPAAVWHLERLQAAGLVGRDKDGRKYRYYTNRMPDPGGSPEVA